MDNYDDLSKIEKILDSNPNFSTSLLLVMIVVLSYMCFLDIID